MTFNSYTFAIFFLIVLGLHYAPLPWRLKKVNLLVASYLFYAAWNPPFVILLWITTLLDFACAWVIWRARTPALRKLSLAVTIVINLGMMGFFKYGGFVLDNFVLLLSGLGIHFAPAAPDIVLPMGISFYTFISLSYTIDVYRGDFAPCPSLLDYALYVTFFPHLVCGPIIRAADLLPQLARPRQASPTVLACGLHLVVLGLFQKVVLADGLLAPIVEHVYDAPSPVCFRDAWTGTLAFAGQIYCDFAGYSIAAVGTALCLGFWLPINFRAPYAAVGFSDFWRRWHISLSTWLRDYLYIPLGGNRKGDLRIYGNLLATMLIGGLWHGASWTFVAWGGLHGLLLSLERALVRRFHRLTAPAASTDTAAAPRPGASVLWPLGALATFIAICFTWVFFRAHGFARARDLVLALVGLTPTVGPRLADRTDMLVVAAVVGGLLAVQWWHRASENVVTDLARLPWLPRSVVFALMAAAIVFMPGEDRAFIYFQF